jgi:hypothetical protein
MCRVSDGSQILDEIYRNGEQASILTREFEAQVTLTSAYTFEVTGAIRVRSVP